MTVLASIAHMQPGDHYCGVYRTDADKLAFVVDFVREGITRNEKMVYIVNVQTPDQLRVTLGDAGVDVDRLLVSGQLQIMSAQEAYLKGGEFDPIKMVDLLREETDQAIAEGYSAMRCTGEMTWALAGEPGSERLIEYEALLNRFFPDSRCYGVCQYDLRHFDSEMLLDIIYSHPKVLYGKEGFDNSKMYYVPPERIRNRDRQGAMLETWLANLSEHGVKPA